MEAPPGFLEEYTGALASCTDEELAAIFSVQKGGKCQGRLVVPAGALRAALMRASARRGAASSALSRYIGFAQAAAAAVGDAEALLRLSSAASGKCSFC